MNGLSRIGSRRSAPRGRPPQGRWGNGALTIASSPPAHQIALSSRCFGSLFRVAVSSRSLQSEQRTRPRRQDEIIAVQPAN